MKKTMEERFDSKVSEYITANGCMLWVGCINNKGYGEFWTGTYKEYAHVVAFYFSKGYWPFGLCVLHSCDTPSCVNPAHLYLGTMIDNSNDMVDKGRNVLPPPRYGEANNKSKLTKAQVETIRSEYVKGNKECSQRALAKKYNVSQHAVSQIVRNLTWRLTT